MKPEPRAIQSDRFAARFRYAPGSTPLDGYTIQQGIGIGGFGEVYFATSDAGKQVALKRIQRNLDVELRGVQNCLNLKHLNLIALFDIRTDGVDDSWVVMEYVPGPSLRDIIEVNETGMPGHQIERWFAPIAAGVEYLHDSGIVHRDLKPANIFLDEDEDVIKIGDYGLSKFISNSHRSGQTETVGTFHYMAPEVGKGIYGKGVDIYAMGIVLYEMLTGDVPFHGESSQEIIMKHLTADPELSEIPFDFREAIQRALLKDPNQRFRSIEELRQFLPWSDDRNGAAKTVLNAERFVLPTRYGIASNAKSNNETENPNFERSDTEAGILFGPLRDSAYGQARQPDIQFVDRPFLSGQPGNKPESDLNATANNEPIAAAIQTGWNSAGNWLRDSSVSTPVKVFVMLLFGIVITANSPWLLPVALGLGLLYLVYFGIRNVVLTPIEGELQPQKLNQRKQQQLIHEAMRAKLSQVDITSRSTALIGGFLVSAVVCVSLNLLGLALTETLFQSSTGSWALFTWSSLISVVASWSLLLVGRFVEKADGDWFQRRVLMLIVGVLVGAFASFMAEFFNVDFSTGSVAFNPLRSAGMVFSGTTFVASILYFAGVFLVLRWWRLVDPTRNTRLSIWAVGLCLIWAALFGHVLDFAPLLNCILIVATSIAVQLSAPWIKSSDRKALVAGNPDFAGAKG